MNDEEKELAYKYAWDWFRHHAKQRYSSFYYYLLIIGALAWGYIQKSNTPEYRFVIGIMSLIISFAFLMIEKRNNMLVNDGRAALKYLEKKYEPFKTISIRMIDEKRKNECFCWWFITHILWFRLVILSSIIISSLAILFPNTFSISFSCPKILLAIGLIILSIIAFVLASNCFEEEYILPIETKNK